MKNKSKNTLYSFVLLICVVVLPAQVQAAKQLKAEKFSDPAQLANIPKEFLDKKIKYEKKVAPDVDVVISLGQQTYPAIHKAIEDIAKAHNIKISIQQGTCGATAKKLLKKTIDIGTFCCPPGKTDRLPGLKFNTVAIAPLALITHKDNPLNDTSAAQAKKIYKGDYVAWSEVPGFETLADKLAGERIKPIVRLHCKKRPGHWRLLIDNQDEVGPRAESVATIPEMVSRVAGHPATIGYETPYMLQVHKNKGDLKMLSIDGKKPDDLENLIKGDYPIYRTYNMTTWSNENNRNEKAELMMASIYDLFQEQGEQYGFAPASKLKLAGWKFKDKELIAEPDGQVIISEH